MFEKNALMEGECTIASTTIADVIPVETMRLPQQPSVTYPLKVNYCGECTMPIEYCEYSGKPEKCRQWLEKNLPDFANELRLCEESGGNISEQQEDEKKHQKRGGKGSSTNKSASEKATTGKAEKPKSKIIVHTAPRGKNKSVTVIKGLNSHGMLIIMSYIINK